MRVPSSLPGFVPERQDAVLPGPTTALPAPAADATSPAGRLRPEFESLLERRLNGWLGKPGTEQHETVSKQARPFLDAEGGIRIEGLPESTKKELVKLQKASEGIEAIFVRQLLSQLRRVSFSGSPKGPMDQFATDTMDQTVADQAAKGRSSIGIAQIVFLDNAQTLVKSAIAEAQKGRTETPR